MNKSKYKIKSKMKNIKSWMKLIKGLLNTMNHLKEIIISFMKKINS